ncbi:MAG: NAD-dependent epimerase/dehydratase family protein [Parvibaculaceae bacterium]
MKYARVAVTGGAGRLGRHVIKALKGCCEVRVLDRALPERTPGVAVDILDPVDLRRALQGVDAVVHLAGLDLDTPAAPEDYVRVNALGTFGVLQAAQDAGARRVVLASSVTATGLGEARPDFPPLYLPVDEDHPLKPRHAYGISKRMAEAAAASFVAENFDVITLRPMVVMFPSNATLVRKHRETGSRWLFYYVDPDDAGRAFRCALEAPEGTNGTFFITAADSAHEEPTLEWLKRSLGRLPEIRDPGFYAANPRASIFDGRRARDTLGFTPTSDWLALSARFKEDA